MLRQYMCLGNRTDIAGILCALGTVRICHISRPTFRPDDEVILLCKVNATPQPRSEPYACHISATMTIPPGTKCAPSANTDVAYGGE